MLSLYNCVVKQLPGESTVAAKPSGRETAALLMDAMPLVMRHIRNEMRSNPNMRGPTLPQFRALVFLSRHQGASLSQVAGRIGLTLPSVSKIVDALVTRGLVTRAASENDRRYVSLSLSKLGRETLAQAGRGTQTRLAEKVAGLSPEQLVMVCEAMQALQSVLGGTGDRSGKGPSNLCR